MKPLQVYCRYHLGDLFAVAHLMRYCAKLHPERRFELYMFPCFLPELLCFTEDTPNFSLFDLEKGIPDRAIDGWKNAEKFWENHPQKNDYAAFTKRWYRRLIRKFGFTDPAPGLLFDLPCLGERSPIQEPYDVLFVNSNPQSGQFLDYTHENSLDPMAFALREKGLRVLTTKPIQGFACTRDMNLSCLQIAQTANQIPQLIAVATGPMWLCLNTFVRKERFTLIMAEKEHVNLVPSVWARTIAQAMNELRKAGLIA